MAKGLPRGIFERPPGSRIYWVRYSDTEGNERREKCGTLTAAKDRLNVRRSERLQGVAVPRLKRWAMGTLIDDAIAYAKAENNEYAAKDLSWKLKIIRADFADKPAAKVRQGDIVTWLDKQAESRKWKTATRNRYLAAFSLLFRVAIDNRKLKENPCRGIKRKREANQRTRFLTAAEEANLLAVVSERFPLYAPVTLLAIHTGMRASELLRAQVGDYVESSGMFQVRQQKDRTAPTFRYVPATPIALEAYRRLAAGKANGDKLCSKQERRNGPNLNAIRYWFDPCCKEIGLVNLHWHDLRHTFASRLVMGGVPLATVAEYMGHKTIQMTMRYSHLSPNTHAQAVAAMMGHYMKNGSGTKSGTGTMKLIKGSGK